MSDDNNLYDELRKALESGGITEHPIEEDAMDILYQQWVPRVKWFRPPMWKIFRWAYRIKKIMCTDCYPVSWSSSLDLKDDDLNGSVEIEFSAKTFENMKLDTTSAGPLESITTSDKGKWHRKTISDAIGSNFYSNEVISIWALNRHDPMYQHLVYRGEAWAAPDEYQNLTINRFIGIHPEDRLCTNNILVKEYIEDIVCGLPKNKRDISECIDGGKNEC